MHAPAARAALWSRRRVFTLPRRLTIGIRLSRSPGSVTFSPLSTLPAGLSVIVCHPGDDVDDLNTMYRVERREELRVLCDPRLKAAITAFGIRLCSWDDWLYLKNHSDRRARG